MGSTNAHVDSLNGSPRKRRSFSLPSFRKQAAAEPQQQTSSAIAAAAKEELARARKAAAWQWHTRGALGVVVPTRVAAAASRLSASPPILSCSRFKAEAMARARATAPSRPPNPLPKTKSTPLYDEVDLSGLNCHMSSFVHRLQQSSKQLDDPKFSAIKGGSHLAHQKTPQPPQSHLRLAEEQTCIRGSSSFSAESGLSSGFRMPVSVFHRIYRKVLSRSSHPSDDDSGSRNFVMPAAADDGPEAGAVQQHHYLRYIHHHHHHYHHYTASTNSCRFSECSDVRRRRSSLVYDNSDDSDDQVNETPHSSLASVRRRHSNGSSFEKYSLLKAISRAATGKLERSTAAEFAEKEVRMQPRKHSSARYCNEAKEETLHEERRPRSTEVKSRRRQSTESGRYCQANATGECTRETRRGGRSAVHGVYKLGSGGGVVTNDECAQRSWRRHSASYGESCRRAEQLINGTLPIYEGDVAETCPRMRPR